MTFGRKTSHVALAALPMLAGGGFCPAAFAQQQKQQQSQTTPAPAAAPQVQSLQEVTVTGSRIKRTTDFNTPVPTTVLDSDTLNNLGVVNLGQALQDIPANLSAFSPSNTGNSAFFTGSYLADLRGLNPFFGSRTLTLIDTQRVVPTNQGDGFDLNFIPNILVQRIDTVTGGASAAYGSGAISGVVNVILDRHLEGGKFNMDDAQTEYSDGKDRHIAAAYGHGLWDDRVHFVLGGEYEHQDAVGCQDARSWCAQDKGFYENGVIPTATGSTTATYGYGAGLHTAVMSPNGVFFPISPVGTPASIFGPASALPLAAGSTYSTLQATPDGTGLIPYTTGVVPFQSPYASVVNTSDVFGGQGTPLYQYSNLMPQVDRGVITGMLDVAVTDDITFKSDWNWGKVTSQTGVFGNSTAPVTDYFAPGSIFPGSPAWGDVTANITPQNAYAQQLAALGNPTILNAINEGYNSLNKDWFPQVPLDINTSTTVKRLSAGFDGKIDGTSWTWDAYLTYGLTNREQKEPDELRAASYSMALDSVLVNGQPECRVTAAGGLAGVEDPNSPYYNPNATYAFNAGAPISPTSLVGETNTLLAQGCVPIDPFGTGAIPSNAFAYSFGNLDERLRYEQTVAALDASGNIWQGIGAGPFSAAVGFEWRQEQANNEEVPSCLPGDSPATCSARSQDFELQFGEPFAGLLTADELYGEVNLPLAKDLPFAHLAAIDIAARESRYDNTLLSAVGEPSGLEATHDMPTFKISGFYEPVDGIRLRGSQSRDERAANFRELYYGQVLQSGATGGFGYCSHTTSANPFDDPCVENLLGNVNLRPETSDTTTLGLVFTPPQLAGLQVSSDWFHIRLTNAIEQADTPEVELACANGEAGACNQMAFNSDVYNAAGQVCGANGVSCTGVPTYTGAKAWQQGIDNATAITATSFNGAFYDEKGVDFSVNYTVGLPDGSTLFLRSLATWTGEQVFQQYAGGPVLDLLGVTSGNALLTDFVAAPKWRGNLSITWQKGVLSVTPAMNWVGHGTIDDQAVVAGKQDAGFEGGAACNTPADLYQEVACNSPAIRGVGYIILPFNYVPSYFEFNLNATLTFEDKLGFKSIQIFTQVNNLLNRAPPFASAPGAFGASGTGGTNPILFDTLGLDTRVGFRATF